MVHAVYHPVQKSVTYICSSDGDPICMNGWREPENPSLLDPLNPCYEPLCQPKCIHGSCIAPDTCACEIGW